ncbi:MAG: hypothetical protein Q8N96_15295 [Methylovulum sp.]|nr:hypothetical protein [Methylovulum sp.]
MPAYSGVNIHPSHIAKTVWINDCQSSKGLAVVPFLSDVGDSRTVQV